MDEELMDIVTDEHTESEDVQYIETDITIEDEEYDILADEIVATIEVEIPETIEVEIEESIGWVGGDSERHYSLLGRDERDQHPITAITGLREELNDIEALDVVCSDERNQANYYLWEDENLLQENRVGYFVSVGSDINEIKLCTSNNDIFGVTVDSAGFIGAQADIPRDIKYGLVVTTGVAHVRCESSVSVGDCVISNDYGYAQKNKNGYKVVGRHRIDGVEYAEITLSAPINQICKLSNDVDNVSQRMGDAETNIIAIMNVANAAYNKASEVGEISEEAIKNALEALDKSTNASNKTDGFESRLESANEVAVQAKTIAESAAVSAESMRNEVMNKANELLAETSELKKELEEDIDRINTDLNNTTLELEETKEGIILTRDELQSNIDGVSTELDDTRNELFADIKNTNKAIADFEQEVENNYAKQQVVTAVDEALTLYKQEVSDTYATQKMITDVEDSLTVFQQEVKDDYATQEMISSVDDALTAYKQEVKDNYATQEMLATVEDNLTSYKQEVTETYATQQMVTTIGDNLTSYKQEVGQTYATQEMVTTLETNTSKALADYKQEVKEEFATQEMVTKLETDTSEALSDYKQEVGNTYATQTSLTTLRTDTTTAIAESEEKATATYASKNDLTSFEGQTNLALANIEQKADANGASINSIVSNVDKYSVGEYSQSYGLTHEQATSILKEGMIYVPTKHNDTRSHSETFADTKEINEFTPGSYYTWAMNDQGLYDWVEYKDLVAFFSEEPVPNDILKYWYIDANEAPEGYEAHALYMSDGEQWTKVNILDGNVNNRITSMIRQTADKIAIDVANAQDKIASHQQWLDDNSANIQDVVSWKSDVENDVSQIATIKQTADNAGASVSLVVAEKDGEKVVNAASIVTAINDAGSSVVIDADHIDISGVDVSLKGQYINISADDVLGIQSKNFNVTEYGDLFCQNADISGVITATSGRIGNFTLDGEGRLYCKITLNEEGKQITYTSGMNSDPDSNYLIYAGETNGACGYYTTNAPFKVDNLGRLWATRGNIGGWDITQYTLQNISDGTATILRSGVYNNEEAFAIGCPMDGEGTIYPKGASFRVLGDGTMYATNAIISGTLSAGSIIGDSKKTGGWSTIDSVYNESASAVYNTNIYNLEICSQELTYNNTSMNSLLRISPFYISMMGFENGRVRCAATVGNNSGALEGTWELGNGEVITSDCNLKHDIESLSEQYSVFFDALKPKRFKYNDGTSDRYHIGFIAQEVCDAFTDAGLDSQEVGAYVHFDKTINKDAHLGLRYDEFIALNTLQIQKAQVRIKELEEKIMTLEQLIKGENYGRE